jgi:hypothetical protein
LRELPAFLVKTGNDELLSQVKVSDRSNPDVALTQPAAAATVIEQTDSGSAIDRPSIDDELLSRDRA